MRDLFSDISSDKWLFPRYNITPGQPLPVMTNGQSSRISWFTWSYQSPGTARSTEKRRPLINARAETIRSLPSFRDSFVHRRCVIWVEGFYEWQRDSAAARSQPYFIGIKDQVPFAIAGLWSSENSTANAADTGKGCLVITTEANSLMHPIHHRMPVILDKMSVSTWLNPETSPETLHAILQPFPSPLMFAHPVSDRVNNPLNQGPDIINPVKIIEQTSLF